MNNEKALEALVSNIRHAMTGTIKNESLALVDELRSALSRPTFEDAVKEAAIQIIEKELERNKKIRAGLNQWEGVAPYDYAIAILDGLLSALKAVAK